MTPEETEAFQAELAKDGACRVSQDVWDALVERFGETSDGRFRRLEYSPESLFAPASFNFGPLAGIKITVEPMLPVNTVLTESSWQRLMQPQPIEFMPLTQLARGRGELGGDDERSTRLRGDCSEKL